MVCIAKAHSDLEGVGIHFGAPIPRKAYSFGNYTFYFYDGSSFFHFHFLLNFAATVYSVEPQKRYKFSYTAHVYLPQRRSMVRVSSMQAQRTVLVIQGHLGKGTDSIPHKCLSLYQQNQRATSCRETSEPNSISQGFTP